MEDTIATCQAPTYEPWTYERVKRLVEGIKAEAAMRRLDDFHVGLLLLGSKTMAYDADASCEGWSGTTEERKEKAHYNIEGKWFFRHPEVGTARYGVFDLDSRVAVPDDEAVCTLERPTFGDYFADKLAHMMRHVGFDAVVLRDNVFTRSYIRGNRERYMPAKDRDDLNAAFVRLLARLKANDPACITIGYDSGSSSMEEWRSHGFDLERLASAGHLDLWITQTWASAWQDYWPCHALGFNFQLMKVLVNLAMLAKTKTRHMFLIETFDAWEPWDSIHQYPSKVKWQIWAYSHAAVRLPEGAAKRSDGCYISWMNKGQELIPEETVRQLCRTMEDSAEDLLDDPVPGGPCLVYDRDGLESLLYDPQPYSRGEEMDDWAAMLQKYGVPILSITRSEWLPSVEADAFHWPAPHRLTDPNVRHLLHKLEAGTPVLFTGQAALLPAELRQALNISVESEPVRAARPSAALVKGTLADLLDMDGLVLNQRQRTLMESKDWETLIECLGGPVFAMHRSLPCCIWETPEWGTPRQMHLTFKSIESPQTYIGVAQTIARQGWGAELRRWSNEDWQKPVCWLFWRYRGGGEAMLLGNLEKGIPEVRNLRSRAYGSRRLRLSNGQAKRISRPDGSGLTSRGCASPCRRTRLA